MGKRDRKADLSTLNEAQLKEIANDPKNPRSAAAQYQLYQYFRNLKTLLIDPEKTARYWLKKSADNLHPEACWAMLFYLTEVFQIAMTCYGDTKEVEAEILAVLENGVKAKIAKMQFLLGLVYSGRPFIINKIKIATSIEPDIKKAQTLICEAINAGEPEALLFTIDDFFDSLKNSDELENQERILVDLHQLMYDAKIHENKCEHLTLKLAELNLLAASYYPEQAKKYFAQAIRSLKKIKDHPELKFKANQCFGEYYYDDKSPEKNLEKAQFHLEIAIQDSSLEDAKIKLIRVYLTRSKDNTRYEEKASRLAKELMSTSKTDKTLADANYIYAQILKKNSNPENAILSAIHLGKAAQKQHVVAMYELAGYYFNDKSRPENIEKALEWMEKAAEKGHVGAYETLSELHFHQEEGLGDASKIARIYEVLYEKNHPLAAGNLGALYIKGGVLKRDCENAIKWLTLQNERFAKVEMISFTHAAVNYKYLLKLAQDMVLIIAASKSYINTNPGEFYKDADGFTLLDYALANNDIMFFKRLILNKKYIKQLLIQTDVDLGRMVQMAMLNGEEFLRALGVVGFDYFAQSKSIYQTTALHLAAEIGNITLICAFLNQWGDCFLKDSKGNTPLHIFVKKYPDRISPSILLHFFSSLKLNNPADPSESYAKKVEEVIFSQDENGDTLMHLAAKKNNFNLFATLGALIHSFCFTKNNEGKIPVQIIIENDFVGRHKKPGNILNTMVVEALHEWTLVQMDKAWELLTFDNLSNYFSYSQELRRYDFVNEQTVGMEVPFFYKNDGVTIRLDLSFLDIMNDMILQFSKNQWGKVLFSEISETIACALMNKCKSRKEKASQKPEKISDFPKTHPVSFGQNEQDYFKAQKNIKDSQRVYYEKFSRLLSQYDISQSYFDSMLKYALDQTHILEDGKFSLEYLEVFFEEHHFCKKHLDPHAGKKNAIIISQLFDIAVLADSDEACVEMACVQSGVDTDSSEETNHGDSAGSSSSVISFSEIEFERVHDSVSPGAKYAHFNHQLNIQNCDKKHALDRMHFHYQYLELLPSDTELGYSLARALYIHFHLSRWMVAAWLLLPGNAIIETIRDWLRHDARYLAMYYENEMLRLRFEFFNMPVPREKVTDFASYHEAIQNSSGYLLNVIRMPTTKAKMMSQTDTQKAIQEILELMFYYAEQMNGQPSLLVNPQTSFHRDVLLMAAERLYLLTNKGRDYCDEIKELLQSISRGIGHQITSEPSGESIPTKNSKSMVLFNYRRSQLDPIPIEPLFVPTEDIEKLLQLLFPNVLKVDASSGKKIHM